MALTPLEWLPDFVKNPEINNIFFFLHFAIIVAGHVVSHPYIIQL